MNPVFEIMEHTFDNDQLIVAGLVLEDIWQNDVILIDNQTYTVKEIISYGYAIDKIDPGMTTKLLLETDRDEDTFPSKAQYAYATTSE